MITLTFNYSSAAEAHAEMAKFMAPFFAGKAAEIRQIAAQRVASEMAKAEVEMATPLPAPTPPPPPVDDFPKSDNVGDVAHDVITEPRTNRGRPKGSKNKNQPSATEAQATSEGAQAGTGGGVAAPSTTEAVVQADAQASPAPVNTADLDSLLGGGQEDVKQWTIEECTELLNKVTAKTGIQKWSVRMKEMGILPIRVALGEKKFGPVDVLMREIQAELA